MPKITDYKAYFKDIATKSGLDEAQLQQVIGAMDNDKFATAFMTGFKPLPDYSHDLDEVKTKTQKDKDAEYKAWHDNELKKYNEYVGVIDEHKKYKEKFGDFENPNPNPDPNPNPNSNPNPNPNSGGHMTKDEIAALLDTQLNDRMGRRDSAMLDLLEVRETHMLNFKKPFDVKGFEAAWKDHPEWGGSLKIAAEKYVEPEVRKLEAASWEAKLSAAREEGIRDGFSRRALPTDHQPKNYASPMFEQKPEVTKLDSNEQERHSREAFFEGLREPAAK